MEMIYKVLYSAAARSDVKAIYEYIAYQLLVPETAKAQVDRIIQAIDSLEKLPYRFKVYDEEPWRNKGLRCFTVDNYMVFYLPIDALGVVRVIRIMYGGRDIKAELDR